MALIRNLSQIREMQVPVQSTDERKPAWKGYGKLIVEALSDVQGMLQNLSNQTNASLKASSGSPPLSPDSVHVTASGGVAHVQIVDNGDFFRGKTYHVAVSPTPGFESPCTLYSGPSRDVRIPVGNQSLYYRVVADNGSVSAQSGPIYHTAGGVSPVPVAATGTEQPAIPSGQGSGTGLPGQISGYGPTPYRGTQPPRRS
jgi:hypothetical protein